MPILNLSNALATFTAQNIGANKTERVKKGLKSAIISSLIFSIVIAVLIFNFGSVFIEMFLDNGSNEAVIDFGIKYLKNISIFYLIMAFMFNIGSILRGAGAMKPFMASTLTNIIVRIVFAYLFMETLGSSVIWLCSPAGWICGTIIAAIAYYSGVWKNTSAIAREEVEEIIEAEVETNTINVSVNDYV